MPDPQTVNLQLNVPAHLSDPGSWDSSLNQNFQALDTVWGGVANVALASSPVTLTPAQWQCQMIIFSGTLGADCVITFPSLGSHHIVANRTTGNFNVILTAGAGRDIALPPQEWIDILTDGSNVDFRNLYVPIGGYVDFTSNAIPSWITACTVPPFLLCDGSAFNTTTYATLAAIMGASTLPDSRGRSRFGLDSTLSRITIVISGVNGANRFVAAGDERIGSHVHGINDPGHGHNFNFQELQVGGGSGPFVSNLLAGGNNKTTDSNSTGITIQNNASGGSGANMPPFYIGGITMIRGF